MNKALRHFKEEIFVQFGKYTLVGIANFLLSLVFYFFLLKVLLIHYLIAFTITWLFGIMLTYVINFSWVFKPEEKIDFRKRLLKYVTVYLISYVINIVLLKYIKENLIDEPFLAQLLILPLVIVINFTGFKYWALH
jgi:putative flippase GtrA